MKSFFYFTFIQHFDFSSPVPFRRLDKMADVFRMTKVLTWLNWNQTKNLTPPKYRKATTPAINVKKLQFNSLWYLNNFPPPTTDNTVQT